MEDLTPAKAIFGVDDYDDDLIHLFNILHHYQNSQKKRKRTGIDRNLLKTRRAQSLDMLHQMDDESFKRMMRLPRSIFYDLLEKITPIIEATPRG